MSSIKLRVSRLAEEVKAAGLAGHSMQDALEKVAQREDLSAEEVHRVAEIANRDVQLALHKTATDKRFKFAVADPKEAVNRIRGNKVATTSVADWNRATVKHEFDTKVASIEEAGGDPFAAPYREPKSFSLYDAPITDERAEKISAANEDIEDRNTLFALDQSRLELEVLQRQNDQEIAKVASDATEHEKQAVQAAMDMIETGLTLPDMYAAMVATCTEEKCEPEAAQAKADQLFGLIVSGLRARGVSVSKMGFRDYYNPSALEALDTDALLEWAREQAGYEPKHMGTISICDTKTASQIYSEVCPKDGPEFTSAHRHSDKGSPTHILEMRDSVKEHKVPDHRVENAENKVNGVRIVNGNNALIIAVNGLVGDQRRITRLHAAQEYLGLKLKEIAEAMNQLAGIREARK